MTRTESDHDWCCSCSCTLLNLIYLFHLKTLV